jgi:membrane-associated phospholipid phosphatase
VVLVGAVLLTSGLTVAGDGAEDVPEERGSIYRLNLLVDIPVTAIGAVGTAVPYLASSTFVHPSCPCDPDDINILDRHAVGNDSSTAETIGNWAVGVAVAGPVALELLTVRNRKTLFEDLAVYAEVMAVNGGLLALSKFVVQRPTPEAYAGNPEVIDRPGGYLSFYSGHTSYAFAALSAGSLTLSLRAERPLIWPWVVTGVVGGGVASVMVLSGAHFPTDVAMGALAGTAVGVGIPLLHLRPSKRVRLVPAMGGRGLALAGRF